MIVPKKVAKFQGKIKQLIVKNQETENNWVELKKNFIFLYQTEYKIRINRVLKEINKKKVYWNRVE